MKQRSKWGVNVRPMRSVSRVTTHAVSLHAPVQELEGCDHDMYYQLLGNDRITNRSGRHIVSWADKSRMPFRMYIVKKENCHQK
jgi:hypothetical protein